MKTLFLPLKKEWYEMIESGVKTEEYREQSEYWWRRLVQGTYYSDWEKLYTEHDLKQYDAVKFSYGYTKRTMTFECKGITIGKGRKELGAPDNDVFIIKLGKRI